jgi:hypothetical protein
MERKQLAAPRVMHVCVKKIHLLITYFFLKKKKDKRKEVALNLHGGCRTTPLKGGPTTSHLGAVRATLMEFHATFFLKLKKKKKS